MNNKRTIKAPTGTSLQAKSWLTEAPLRMLMNNLDPEVADMPIATKQINNVKLERVMSNSFGFGGTNATLVLQKYHQ